MSRNHFFYKVAVRFLCGTALSLMGCTRDVAEKVTISVSVPSSLSSLTGSEKLEYVVINARATPTSSPKVWSFDHMFSSVSAGGSVTITITGEIPSSPTLLIQFMGVFVNDNGTMRFSYGDTFVDSTKSGDIAANITAVTSGSSTKEGRVGGRYLTSASSGPTGRLLTMFVPPNGQPSMEVDSSEIVNGWFSIMAFEGTQNTGDINVAYKIVKDDGVTEMMFPGATGNLNLSSPMFNGSDALSRIAKVVVPATFQLDRRNSGVELRSQAERELVVGYFGKDASVSIDTFLACYPDGYAEALPNIFMNSALTTVLGYVSGGSSSFAHEVNGSSTISNPTCRAPGSVYATSLNIYHEKLRGHDGEVFGMRGVFAMLNPTAEHDSAFVRLSIDDSSANPKAKFDWRYLPGTHGAGVDGLTIFAKYSIGSDGGGQDNHDLNCQQRASSEGYIPVVDTANSNSFTLVNPPGFAAFSYNGVSADSIFSYRYYLCPYRAGVNGVRQYLAEGVRADCLGGDCGQWESSRGFGRKIPGHPGHDLTLSPSTGYSFTSTQVGGRTARVQNLTAHGTNADWINLGVSSSYINFPEGSEVIAIVMANHSNDCGSFAGNQISAGQYVFSKVVESNSGNVAVNRGSFLDKMIGVPGLNVATTAADHCYLQLVKVAEWGNLTMSNNSSVIADPFDGTSANGGGIVALRVNGVLTMNSGSGISAVGKGYACSGTACNGQSPDSGYFMNGTGSPARAGGGGAHMGQGGNGGGDGTTPGGVGAMNYGMGTNGMGFHFLMGSAGGAAYLNSGGSGGGIVFLFARQLVLTGNAMIAADGASGGVSVVGEAPGGGGGGGTVMVNAFEINTGVNLLIVKANGGGGGNTGDFAQERSGGGGGGGYAELRRCKLAAGSTNPTVLAMGGIRTPTFADEGTTPSTAGQMGYVNANMLGDNCPP